MKQENIVVQYLSSQFTRCEQRGIKHQILIFWHSPQKWTFLGNLCTKLIKFGIYRKVFAVAIIPVLSDFIRRSRIFWEDGWKTEVGWRLPPKMCKNSNFWPPPPINIKIAHPSSDSLGIFHIWPKCGVIWSIMSHRRALRIWSLQGILRFCWLWPVCVPPTHIVCYNYP